MFHSHYQKAREDDCSHTQAASNYYISNPMIYILDVKRAFVTS